MKNLHEILELADQELGSVAQSGRFRSREEIHSVYELIDIAKDIICIERWEDEDYEMRGDSYNDGMSYDRDGRTYRNSYDDGESYARRKRDSMGRYSRDYDGRSMRGYSRDGKESYMENLRRMMDEAPDDQTRQSIKRMLDNMQ